MKRELQPVNIETDTGKLRQRHRLHEAIDQHFNITELDDLAYRLGYVPENIMSATSRKQRAMELVLFMIRHGKEKQLIDMLETLRPFVKWQHIMRGE